MMQGFKNMGNILKQAKEMKGKMSQIQDELKKAHFSGYGLDKKIEIQVTGEFEVTKVEIDPEMLKKTDAKKLEKGLKEAISSAISQAKKEAADKLSVVTQGLQIPGL